MAGCYWREKLSPVSICRSNECDAFQIAIRISVEVRVIVPFIIWFVWRLLSAGKAQLLAGRGVFAIENPGPLEHDVTLIHNRFMNREPVRLTRVNE
jgi:hypothetical protein